MSQWSAAKAKRVLAALLRIGWRIKRQSGSHRTLSRTDWPDIVFAFHDNEELVPVCLRVSRNIRDSCPMISEPYCVPLVRKLRGSSWFGRPDGLIEL